MNNHLNQPQKTQLRQKNSKTLILQGFQPPKNTTVSAFLPYFLYILEPLQPSYITKKLGNPYIFCVLKPYYFFL